MKANEFIKKFGFDETKRVVRLTNGNSWADHYDIKNDAIGTAGTKFSKELCDKNDNFVFISDLKRLIESHKLVNNLCGLEEAKSYLSLSNVRIDGLKQAITDVESCL